METSHTKICLTQNKQILHLGYVGYRSGQFVVMGYFQMFDIVEIELQC